MVPGNSRAMSGSMIGMELLIKLKIVWAANVFLAAKMRGSSTHHVPEIGRAHRAGRGTANSRTMHTACHDIITRSGTLLCAQAPAVISGLLRAQSFVV